MPGSLGNLGGVSYDIIAEDKTQQGTSSAVAGLARVTAAFASVAAASTLINNATDAYDKMSQTSVLTSAKLGISVDAMNEAVKRAARENSDFVSDTSAGFDLLARSGETSLGQIAEDYKHFSEMGKVAGQSAASVEEQVIPALKAFGLEVSDAAKYEDVFISVTRDTTMSLGEFTGFISRSALNLKALGLSIEDTAAIFEILADKGIQGRQAMRVFSTAMQEQADAMKVGEDAAKDYADAQEELKEAQDKSAMSLEEYQIRMAATGRDVAAARNLTMQRRIDLLRENAEEDKIREKAATAQSAMASAKSQDFDVYKALGVTQEEVQGKKDLIESNRGLTEKLATGIEGYETATEKQAQAMEQTTLAAGQLLDPIKDATSAVKTLSTVLTVVGTGATILQATGALKGGGGLAGGGGGIAGGLGKAGGVARGAGAAGGIAEGLGVGSAGAYASTLPAGAAADVAMGGEVFAPAAAGEAGNFLAMSEAGALGAGAGATEGGTIAGMEALLTSGGMVATMAVAAGLVLGAIGVAGMEMTGITSLWGDITGDKSGKKGMVEQAGGAFVDALTGDTENAYIMSYAKQGQAPPGYHLEPGKGYVRDAAAIEPVAEDVFANPAASAPQTVNAPINIQNVTLSKDYPFEQFEQDMVARQSALRTQKGL